MTAVVDLVGIGAIRFLCRRLGFENYDVTRTHARTHKNYINSVDTIFEMWYVTK